MDPQATAPQREPIGIAAVVLVYALISLVGGLIAGAIFSARDEPPIVLQVGAISFCIEPDQFVGGVDWFREHFPSAAIDRRNPARRFGVHADLAQSSDSNWIRRRLSRGPCGGRSVVVDAHRGAPPR